MSIFFRSMPRFLPLYLSIPLLYCFSLPCRASAPRSPELDTVWDRIMQEQAYRSMHRGSFLMDTGNYPEAVREFARAVIESPQEPWTHIMLGTALYWSGQVDQAVQEFLQSVQLDETNAQAHQLLGIASAWKGDAAKAFDEFSKAVKYAPERADIQMDIGSIYESMGKPDMALKHFRNAVGLEPGQPLYHFQLGSLYSRLGRDSDAKDSLEKAVRSFGGYEDALLELGAVHERMGDRRSAVGVYYRAVRIKPMDSVARFRLALALVREGARGDAQAVLRDAFRLMPEGKGDGLSLSLAYAGKGADPKSGKSKDSGASSRTQAGPMNSLLRNLERIPLNQEAKVQVELFYLPKPELVSSRPQERKSLKSALEKSASGLPNAMGIHREFDIPASDSQTRDERIKYISGELEKALKDAPPNSDMRMSMNVQTGRGGSMESGQGRPGLAQKSGKVSYQPRAVGNDMGLWVMGSAWLDLIHEVMPGLRSELAESSGTDWVILGLGQVMLGEPDEALESFSRAASAGSAELGNMGSAVAWIEKGDEDNAMAACEEVLRINPKNRIARDNLKWLKTPSTISKESVLKPGKTGEGN